MGAADEPRRRGARRHHVRRGAGLGEVAVHALARPHVLAHRGHVHVAEHGGVERVAAELGRGGGVRREPVVDHAGLVDRDGVDAGEVGARGVDHEGGVDTVEGPGGGEVDLAATALLGRRAEHGEAPAQLLGDRGRGEPRPEPGRADDVVAARVPDLRQGVVLAQHGHVRAVGVGPGGGRERGVEPVDVALDLQPALVEHRREGVVGVVLGVPDLGVGVQVVGDLDQPVGPPVDLGEDAAADVGGIGRHDPDPTGPHPHECSVGSPGIPGTFCRHFRESRRPALGTRLAEANPRSTRITGASHRTFATWAGQGVGWVRTTLPKWRAARR